MTAPTRAELAASVDNARFTPVRLRQGYSMGDVDSFLDLLSGALRAGNDVAKLVDDARFATVGRGREAYDMAEVDSFLDRVVSQAAATVGEATAPAADDPAPAAPASAPSGPSGLNPELVGLIRTTKLGSKMFGEGYDKSAVDGLLNQLIQRLDAGQAFDDLILNRIPQRRGGYATAQVDDLLKTVRFDARYA